MMWLLFNTDVFLPFKAKQEAAVCPPVQLLFCSKKADHVLNKKEAAAASPSGSSHEPLEDGEIEEHVVKEVHEELSKSPVVIVSV